MPLSEEQGAVVREAFYMFRDAPAPDDERGPGGRVSPGALLTLLRSLGFPVAEADLEGLSYAAGRAGPGGARRPPGEPFSYGEVEAAVEALRARGPRGCEEEIRVVWEALEPRDGLVPAETVRRLLSSPELGGELAPEDVDALLGHLGAGGGAGGASGGPGLPGAPGAPGGAGGPESLTFEQFRQLVQPPAPLV